MRDVAVIGVGMNRWGELWEKSHRQIWTEAALEAIEDAGVDHVDAHVRRLHERRALHGPGASRRAARRPARHGTDPGHPGRVGLRFGRAGLPAGVPGRGVGRARHRAGVRRREDDRRRRRRRHLRPLDRGRPGVRVLPRDHVPRALRHDGARAHAPLRHHARAAGRRRGEEPRARLDESPGAVPDRRSRSSRSWSR